MRLVRLSTYRNMIYAPGEGPALKTLRARIDTIPGGKIEGGRYWVDLDALDEDGSLRLAVAKQEQTLARNPLLDGLL